MRTSYSFLALLQNAGFSRFMVGVVISAMVAPVYQPVSAAMDPVPDPEDDVQELDVPPGQALSHSVRKAKGLLGRAGQGLRRGEAISAERQELADLRRVVAELDTEVRREFERTGLLLAERKVPASIRARHEETFARYREEIETLLEDLVNIETETDEDSVASTIGRAYERLSQQKHQSSQRPFDPNQLPHEAQRPPEDNLPRTTREEFLGAGLVDNPLVQLAAIEGYRLEGLPGADDPAYLGESTEVRLSPEVNAKAAELDHDPVAIYHWVRNHVEWLPTWGAVQDSDLTLSARRGNAMDTASLLIALLRASGIPARYVHGTIDVPEKAFRNWAGGFQHIEEAMNYAASGGIPLTGLIEGGNIAHVRMEHVWVEAAVDFLPSRGAVMREADTWLPLDPSFKQYEFLVEPDLAVISEIDGKKSVEAFLDTGTTALSDGWMQALDPSAIAAEQLDAEKRIATHIDQLDAPNVGDVLGGRDLIAREQPVMPSALPYRTAFPGVRYSDLPQLLQTRIAIYIATDDFGAPLNPVAFPWAEINNRKVTLSFRPATEEDQVALESFIPEDEIHDFSQLPSSIPAYTVQVIPELKVEGIVKMTAAPLLLGQELALTFKITDPSHGVQTYSKAVAGGSYIALGVIGGGVPSATVNARANALLNISNKLETASPENVLGFTRDQFIGELLHSGLSSYFAQYQAVGQLTAQTQGWHMQLTTSAGSFGYIPTVSYLFGLPHALTEGGWLIDLDRVGFISNTDGDGKDSLASLNFQLGGLASALEHAMPEQMLSPGKIIGEGVSTVSVLHKAVREGQRVHHLTPENRGDHPLELTHDPKVLQEIERALYAGREVVVHAHPVRFSGWEGAGYVIFDPETGAGAWKITGGANGGFLGEVEEAFSKPMFHLSASQTAAYLLTKTFPIVGTYRTAIRDTGNVLLGVGAFITVVEVRNETESNWKGVAAGSADLAVTMLGGVTAKALFGAAAAANPVVAAVVISVALGVLVSSSRTQVIEYIKQSQGSQRGGWA